VKVTAAPALTVELETERVVDVLAGPTGTLAAALEPARPGELEVKTAVMCSGDVAALNEAWHVLWLSC